ncbi:MAG TPA: lasso peptide biosynthesis B2 protein [Pyrinomonadaceae bacterium]|nr:lasso peptide biosynthesis B2 protein [Pyrinomonadaceae bacterium]
MTVLRAARLAARDPATCLLVLRMAFWVLALVFLMRVTSLRRAVRLVAGARPGPPPSDPRATRERLARILDSLLAADFWVFTPTCWKRAPVLRRFLAAAGIEAKVVFGVRRGEGGRLDGHAWLEAGGEPLLEATEPDYRPTFAFPA